MFSSVVYLAVCFRVSTTVFKCFNRRAPVDLM